MELGGLLEQTEQKKKKEEREEVEEMLEDVLQKSGNTQKLTYSKTPQKLWNLSTCELMLTNIQSIKPKIDMIIHVGQTDIWFLSKTEKLLVQDNCLQSLPTLASSGLKEVFFLFYV